MAFRIYQQQVGPGGLPGYRQNIDNPLPEATARLGQAVSQSVQQADAIRRHEREKQQNTMVLDGAAKLADADMQLRDGFKAQEGTNVLQSGETILQNYDARTKAIGEGIKDPEALVAFKQHATERRLEFQQFVNQHTQQQLDRANDEAANAVAAKSINEASELAPDIAANEASGDSFQAGLMRGMLERRLRDGRNAIALRAASSGTDPTVQLFKYTTEAHSAVINSMADAGHPEMAAAYLRDNRHEIDHEVASKLGPVLQEHVDKQVGQTLADGAVANATVSAVRTWAPTIPVASVDETKVLAAVANAEADPEMSPIAKASFRAAAERAVNERQASAKAALDQTYDRGLKRLMANGWDLTGLAEERRFLLDPKVQGGASVWGALESRARQMQHVRRGAGPTAEQRDKMAEFWLTLPDRKTEYVADPSKFEQEWAAVLAPSDYEQAASYVGKSGVSANKDSAVSLQEFKAQAEARLSGISSRSDRDRARKYMDGMYAQYQNDPKNHGVAPPQDVVDGWLAHWFTVKKKPWYQSDVFAVIDELEQQPGSAFAQEATSAQAPKPPPSAPQGAVRVTDGKRFAWLPPGTAMPDGWRPAQ